MPQKKRSSCPLYRHANGQWCKRILGKIHYFGTEQRAALKRFLEEKDDLFAGRTPRTWSNGLRIGDLCDVFLNAKRLLMQSGELSARTWQDYFDSCERIIKVFGSSRPVLDLTPADFERLRAEFAEGCGPITIRNRVKYTRTIFKYAFDADLIDRPLRFGPHFKPPSRRIMRAARLERGSKVLSSSECRALLQAAKQPLRAMILLALNCGFGQSDLSSLPRSAVDLKSGWVNFPRPKTAIPRRCPLWPETVAALRIALKKRPDPKDPADAGLCFLTRQGNRWVRFYERPEKRSVGIDSITLEFKKLLRQVGITRKGIGPYALRHTFRTIADGSKDQPAIDAIMGHVGEDMARHYRDGVDDSRLKCVVDVVRTWLFEL